jgi:hypothetical protein
MNPLPFIIRNSIVALAVLCACGRSDRSVAPPPPPPLVASSVAVTSGNNQSATINHLLPQPLVVTVTTSTGDPIPGATVDWVIPSGFGIFTPPGGSQNGGSTTTIVTDANGQASVGLNVGASPGSHTVVVTVRGTNLEARFDERASAPIILHYDGTSWSVALEDSFGGVVLITSVSGIAPSKALAGGFGCSESQILSYNGTAWGGGCRGALMGGPVVRGIGANAANDVFAVETLGRPNGYPSYISHFDGQVWSVVYNHKTGTTRLPDLHAVGTRAGDDVIAVGDSGTMVHFSGGESWTLQQSGTTKNLEAVWLDRASSASFVVGDGGTILFSNGGAWGVQSSGTTQTLYAVWGTSASDVFAVGDSGTILHYDGATWTAQTSGTTQSLRGVWGDASGSVFAVGVGGTILHYDGSSWSAQPVAASMDIFGVWGTSGTNLFAVGGPR